jgi:ergothioneine biosynthesis protein EgtB
MNPSPSRSAAEEQSTNLLLRFQSVRAQTMALIEGLSDEDCVVQAMPDASPLKWHLAHTTWFFEVFVLENFLQGFRPFDAAFKVLFNSYYNGVGEKYPRPHRGLLTRPSLERVKQYRTAVDEQIAFLLGSQTGVFNSQIDALIVLGIHHEQQHQELMLTDFKYLLSLNPLLPAYRIGWPLISTVLPQQKFLGFRGGLMQVGRSAKNLEQYSEFSFDNEGPEHQVFLRDFELSNRPITYGDVLEFIDAGGYQRPEFWLSMGWDFVRTQSLQAPLYWQRHTSAGAPGWFTFTLRGLCPIALDVPVPHLSYFEADALARFNGARLPTEAEWEHAAKLSTQGHVALEQGNFLEDKLFHPTVARSAVPSTSPSQLYGDVWEWTQSSYEAYPGYRSDAGAIGEYNGKFMCGQYVLRGGSCVTPRAHIRNSYRNFFPPSAQWQFSGARLARDLG